MCIVGDVLDMYLFKFVDVGGLQQVVIDGDGIFVVQFGVSDGGVMDFGFEQGEVYGM